VLSEILTPGLAAFLRSPPPERATYRTPQQLDAVLDGWQAAGAAVVTLGHSKQQRPIRAAVFGHGPRTMLAWGYPHPDEPLGAEALCWLGDGLAAGRLPDLDGWRCVLVLCADPDEASRQRWMQGPRDARAFVSGAWRPSKLDWMVDYGFPLDWGPFWHPADYEGACRTRRECLRRCGPDGCLHEGHPHGPLPESLALAAAIDRFQPDVVAAMHNTHTGGDYTFLLEREDRRVMEALVALPGCFGLQRHLGEPIDRGRRWMADSPDLIQEPDLDDFRRELERIPGYDPQLVYQRNHSAGAYVQAQGRGAQFVCPESTMFRSVAFGDTSPLGERTSARVTVADRRRGRYELTWVRSRSGEWVVAHQRRVAPSTPARDEQVDVEMTRGMLGVLALVERRRALKAADALWARVRTLAGLAWHPYMEERALLSVPGAFVHDRSMLIFRTRPDYQRPATRAQAASFRWLWPLHTASLLGNFRVFLAAQNQDRFPQLAEVDAQLARLQDAQLAKLPGPMLVEGARGPAMGSMLARVMALMLAR